MLARAPDRSATAIWRRLPAPLGGHAASGVAAAGAQVVIPHIALLGTVLFGTVLLGTVLFGTVLLGTVLFGAALLGMALLGMALLGTVLFGPDLFGTGLSARLPGCRPGGAAHGEQDRQHAAADDGGIGEVEHGPVRQFDPVHHVAAHRPGGAEQPVREVAGGAAEQQAERDRPGQAAQLRAVRRMKTITPTAIAVNTTSSRCRC